MECNLETIFFQQLDLLQDVEETLKKALAPRATIESHLTLLRSLRSAMKKHKGCADSLFRVGSLIHECKKRLVNHKIDKVAERAQSLKMGAQNEARELREKILNLCSDNALSFENRQMVLFTRKLLQKIDPNGKILHLPHNDEFGVEAFEIAHLLFRNELGMAKRAISSIPKWFHEELDEWIQYAGSTMKHFEVIPDLNVFYEERWHMIRALIGFATGELPSVEEAEQLFSELESVIESA
jgi:hypothetical protein